MHCLEVIVARNSRNFPASSVASPIQNASVQDMGKGKALVQFRLNDEPRALLVDASNPLDDKALCDFHRNWTGPKSIAHAVEQIASQWRRIVSASSEWTEAKPILG